MQRTKGNSDALAFLFSLQLSGPKGRLQAVLAWTPNLSGQQPFYSDFLAKRQPPGHYTGLREGLTFKSKSLSMTYPIKSKCEWYF